MEAPLQPTLAELTAGPRRWMSGLSGVTMVLTGLALAVAWWFIPAQLVKIRQQGIFDPSELPALARALVAARSWMPLSALPLLFFGALLVAPAPRRRVWLCAGFAWMVGLTALLLYTAVIWIGALYQYRPLD